MCVVDAMKPMSLIARQVTKESVNFEGSDVILETVDRLRIFVD